MTETTTSKKEQLAQLRRECYLCENCSLCKNTEYPVPKVFGEGSVNSRILLLGQNPGSNEIKLRRPFVGLSGKRLDEAIKTAGLDRRQLYIHNSVLCYTTGNATPPQEAIDACKHFFESVVSIIQPKVVVVLGASAWRTVMPGELFSVERCKDFCARKSHHFLQIDNIFVDLIPTVHPAYTLRNRADFPILVDSLLLAKEFAQ